MTAKTSSSLFAFPESTTASGRMAVVQYTDSDKDHYFCGLVASGPDFFDRLKTCLESHFDAEVSISDEVDLHEGWNILVTVSDDIGEPFTQEVHFHFEKPY